jgi:hypothetical protein
VRNYSRGRFHCHAWRARAEAARVFPDGAIGGFLKKACRFPALFRKDRGHRNGSNCSARGDEMIRIDLDFEPHPFERSVVEQTKEDIRNRLNGQEFGAFKIVLKRSPGSQQFAWQFLGDPESCEKARRLLGIY